MLEMKSMTWNPDVVSLPAKGSAKIVVELTISSELGLSDYLTEGDPSATFMPSQLAFTGPDQAPINLFIIPTESLVSTDGKLDNFVVELDLPQWVTANGEYLLEYLLLCDNGGNEAVYDKVELRRTGFMYKFTVTGGRVDRDPPILLDIILPDQINQTHMVDVILEETVSGLAHLENPTFMSGSFIDFRCRDSPEMQHVTVHFDDADKVQCKDNVAMAPECERWTGSPSLYRLNVTLPDYAWGGNWEIATAVITDEAGNYLKLSRRELEEWGIRSTFGVLNKNLTYMGDDVFHYVEQQWEEPDEYADAEQEDYYY